MRTASRSLADGLRATQRLQVVRELLAAGERLLAGEHVHRLRAAEARAFQIAERPRRRDRASIARVHIVEVSGRVEEIARDERDGLRRPAVVVAQVDNERVGICDLAHQVRDAVARVIGDAREAVDDHVSHVAGHALDRAETVVHRAKRSVHVFRRPAATLRRVPEQHTEMQIVTDVA